MLIQRILFLEGIPDMQTRPGLHIGKAVPEMLQSDLDVEYAVANALRAAIAMCEKERDYVTREILEKLLDDTEVDHAFWLEQQLGLIKTIGLENYIQSQL
jgi:bacterioferritin